jgi:uncharacterized membrane protein YphA (DoxX/SURF4 family)
MLEQLLALAAGGLGSASAGLFVNRVGVGLFYAIRGWQKVTSEKRRAGLRTTLVEDGVPFPDFNKWWVPANQALFGTMLVLGLWSAFAAAVLAIVTVVAIVVDGWDRVKRRNPVTPGDWVACAIYLGETLLLFPLAVVMLAGPGSWALN